MQANLTLEQTVIAEYWADGPKSELPPGHWCLFSAFVAQRDALGFDDTAKLFFVVANAILDASIATWEAKRFYDYARPVTAIRHLFRGKSITVDPSLPAVGVTLGWDTFREAAAEAGESRLYGGIHFYEGNVVGLDLVVTVGNRVFAKAEKHWLGTI